jgi:phage/plasmid primase-like uncharacterized protein
LRCSIHYNLLPERLDMSSLNQDAEDFKRNIHLAEVSRDRTDILSKFTNIPIQNAISSSFEKGLAAKLEEFGLDSSEVDFSAGGLQRFRADAEDTKDSAWVVITHYADGLSKAVFSSHRWPLGPSGKTERITYQSKEDTTNLTPEELEKRKQARKERDEEQQRAQKEGYAKAALVAQRIWASGKITESDRYLEKKDVQPKEIRHCSESLNIKKEQQYGALMVPMYRKNQIVSIQFITASGKRYLPGSSTEGAYNRIGTLKGADGPLCLCEGYATGLTIHEATGWSVLVCFSASGMVQVARGLGLTKIHRAFLVCGDDDYKTAGNPGETAAKAAVEILLNSGKRASATLPNFVARSWQVSFSDFNDLQNVESLTEVASQLHKAYKDLEERNTSATEFPSKNVAVAHALEYPFTSQRSTEIPIEAIVQGFLYPGFITTLVAPQRSFKTTLAITLAASVASGTDFYGISCKQNSVFYIDQDEPSRWRTEEQFSNVFPDWEHSGRVLMPDPEGELYGKLDITANGAALLEAVKKSGARVLVIDTWRKTTLRSGLVENSNTDMYRPLAILSEIAKECDCAILILHHTSKGGTRGSGAGILESDAQIEWAINRVKDKQSKVTYLRLTNKTSRFKTRKDLFFELPEDKDSCEDDAPPNPLVPYEGSIGTCVRADAHIQQDEIEGQSATLAQLILEALTQNYGGLSVKELVIQTGGKDNAIRSTLSRLKQAGKVEDIELGSQKLWKKGSAT